MALAAGAINKRIKMEEIPQRVLYPITNIEKYTNGRYADAYEVELCGNVQVFLPAR